MLTISPLIFEGVEEQILGMKDEDKFDWKDIFKS